MQPAISAKMEFVKCICLSIVVLLSGCASLSNQAPAQPVTVENMVAATQKALKQAADCMIAKGGPDRKPFLPIESATLSVQATNEHKVGAGLNYLVIQAGANRDETHTVGLELNLIPYAEDQPRAADTSVIDAQVDALSEAICAAGLTVKPSYPDKYKFNLKTNQVSVKVDFSLSYDANAQLTVTPVQLSGSISGSKAFDNSIAVTFSGK